MQLIWWTVLKIQPCMTKFVSLLGIFNQSPWIFFWLALQVGTLITNISQLFHPLTSPSIKPPSYLYFWVQNLLIFQSLAWMPCPRYITDSTDYYLHPTIPYPWTADINPDLRVLYVQYIYPTVPILHICSHLPIYPFIKGTAARDFLPLVFSTNWPHIVPESTP